MEKYIIVLLLTAPGFIAKKISKCLGDIPAPRSELENVLVYFVYSLFSFLATLTILNISGQIYLNNDWSYLEHQFTKPWFCLNVLLISSICSAVIGGVWTLYGEKLLLKMFNEINLSLNKNLVYLTGSMLHELFDDDKNHLIQIEKDGKIISFGFYGGLSSPTSSRVEIILNFGEEWQKSNDEYLKNNKHKLNKTYYDMTNLITIKEYEIPKEWNVPN